MTRASSLLSVAVLAGAAALAAPGAAAARPSAPLADALAAARDLRRLGSGSGRSGSGNDWYGRVKACNYDIEGSCEEACDPDNIADYNATLDDEDRFADVDGCVSHCTAVCEAKVENRGSDSDDDVAEALAEALCASEGGGCAVSVDDGDSASALEELIEAVANVSVEDEDGAVDFNSTVDSDGLVTIDDAQEYGFDTDPDYEGDYAVTFTIDLAGIQFPVGADGSLVVEGSDTLETFALGILGLDDDYAACDDAAAAPCPAPCAGTCDQAAFNATADFDPTSFASTSDYDAQCGAYCAALAAAADACASADAAAAAVQACRDAILDRVTVAVVLVAPPGGEAPGPAANDTLVEPVVVRRRLEDATAGVSGEIDIVYRAVDGPDAAAVLARAPTTAAEVAARLARSGITAQVVGIRTSAAASAALGAAALALVGALALVAL